jgi:hypothetical protein
MLSVLSGSQGLHPVDSVSYRTGTQCNILQLQCGYTSIYMLLFLKTRIIEDLLFLYYECQEGGGELHS